MEHFTWKRLGELIGQAPSVVLRLSSESIYIEISVYYVSVFQCLRALSSNASVQLHNSGCFKRSEKGGVGVGAYGKVHSSDTVSSFSVCLRFDLVDKLYFLIFSTLF